MRILCHIHTFSDEEVIDHCGASVPSQTRPSDQLRIVDDALMDMTLDLDFPPDTEIIRNTENLGTSGAVDAGLCACVRGLWDGTWHRRCTVYGHTRAGAAR